tara:strand:- start:485 stop:931 length:447 start_codon:yes stop_codon:yes gene_type:complete
MVNPKNIKDSNPKDAIGVRKPALSVLSMPVLFEQAAGLSEGACKYGRSNYRVMGVRASVYYDATMRHLAAWWEGENIDPESGIHHISKAMSSLHVLRDAMMQGKCSDDRPPVSNESWIREAQERIEQVLDRHPNPKPPYTQSNLEDQS